MFDVNAPLHRESSPRLMPLNGVQIREDVIYTNHKGEEKKAIRKRAEKILEQLGEPVRQVLDPGEAILFVAEARRQASTLEQMTMGWAAAQAVTMTRLIFTNRRLLHFRVKRDGRWMRCWRSLSWGDVQTAKVTGWLDGHLELKYRNNTKEKYWGVSGGDRRKIKVLLEALLPVTQADGTPAQAMVSLCPQCRVQLTSGVYQCPGCSLVFKDEKSLLRRLAIPGGVFFYTGHPVLGIFDLLTEGYLLLLIVAIVIVAVATPDDPDASLGAAAFFLLVLVFEKMVTLHHGRTFVKEFLPA